SERNTVSSSYAESGVNVQAGYDAVRLMRGHVERTMIPGVIGGIGGFGGMFALPEGMKSPVLVSGTDGVGTKLKIAFAMNRHNTVGVDCVAMCANDVLCCGARPLFFLDYVAVGRNIPERVAEIVSGVAEGCVQSECALIGGETAEMPGFYPENEYDIAGFCVGVVERDEILDPHNVREGDVIIALPSTGVHSNGFSLVRKVFADVDVHTYVAELGRTLGEELLTPTRIYVKDVLPIMRRVKSIAHITGGGFWENIPRAIPEGLSAKINLKSITVPPIFDVIMRTGNIPVDEMYHVFNMGAGMMIICANDEADEILRAVDGSFVAGEIVKGEGGLILC
ncbi:MAG: phosphoribosylformylglycinamidine cyclo-ligase, partial [Synergistaceae bacterium]|nr:phosphoribosylformylglycinamidine cyclo-ligase [Synergistaceae bacterium]